MNRDKLKGKIESTIRYHIDPDEWETSPDKVSAAANEIITLFSHLGLIRIEDNEIQEID